MNSFLWDIPGSLLRLEDFLASKGAGGCGASGAEVRSFVDHSFFGPTRLSLEDSFCKIGCTWRRELAVISLHTRWGVPSDLPQAKRKCHFEPQPSTAGSFLAGEYTPCPYPKLPTDGAQISRPSSPLPYKKMAPPFTLHPLWNENSQHGDR